ncbi:hypothetical protein ACP4OV_014715 [Aristida adscensionis]
MKLLKRLGLPGMPPPQRLCPTVVFVYPCRPEHGGPIQPEALLWFAGGGRRRRSPTVDHCDSLALDHVGLSLPRLSFDLAAPPASSSLLYDCAHVDEDHEDAGEQTFPDAGVQVMAAHSDSVLLEIRGEVESGCGTYEYFVYSAGAARPPSMSPLAVAEVILRRETVGLLRRGEDELLVVRLALTPERAKSDTAKLHVVRAGGKKWELRDAGPVVVDEGAMGDGEQLPFPDAVVPVGDRFLCWPAG